METVEPSANGEEKREPTAIDNARMAGARVSETDRSGAFYGQISDRLRASLRASVEAHAAEGLTSPEEVPEQPTQTPGATQAAARAALEGLRDS